MSGPAAYALVLLKDPRQLVTQKLYPSGEHLPPSRGESPLPLDCYLSWMSPQLLSPQLQILLTPKLRFCLNAADRKRGPRYAHPRMDSGIDFS
jgi:hypothetical protein